LVKWDPPAKIGQLMGVGGGGDRHPVVVKAGKQSGCWVDLAAWLAPASGVELCGEPPGPYCLCDPVIKLIRHGRTVPGDFGQVRMRQHIRCPGTGQFLDGPGVIAPDLFHTTVVHCC